MKRVALFIACILAPLYAMAQYYPDGRPIPPRKRATYYASHGDGIFVHNDHLDTYYGFRMGMSVASVNSEASALDGSDPKVGLDLGAFFGVNFVPRVPIYFETGAYYTEKGGKGNQNGSKFTYNLNYLEVPFLLKYKIFTSRDVTIDPFVGGYVAMGVGGKIKNYGERRAYSSFNDNETGFRRFDSGLKIGCSLNYQMLTVGVGYDLGLANVGHYDFEDTKNRSFNVSIGMTF